MEYQGPIFIEIEVGDWQEFLGYEVVLCNMYENPAIVLHIFLYVNRKQTLGCLYIQL